MKAITLPNVREALALDRYHVSVPPDIAKQAAVHWTGWLPVGSER
jgi:hypothetical protein